MAAFKGGSWADPQEPGNRQRGNLAYIDANGNRVGSTDRRLRRGDQQYNDIRQWVDPGGLFSKKKRLGKTYLWDSQPGVEGFLQTFEKGGSSSDAIYNLLNTFKGSPKDLQEYMKAIGPMFGALEANRFQASDAFQYMEDPSNWDMGAWSGYGQQAAGIGRGTQQAIAGSQANLARAGLGRSGANAGMTALLQQQGIGQQAAARGQTEQMAAQNTMRSATQMQDAYRLLAQMSLSQQLTPRVYDNGGGGGMSPYAGAAGGAMAGAQIGMAAGPYGALAGAAIGGVAGYAGSK